MHLQQFDTFVPNDVQFEETMSKNTIARTNKHFEVMTER